MHIYRFELKRAFRTPGFYLAVLTGCIIALGDWMNYALQASLEQELWLSYDYSMKYPANVFEKWIGGGDSKYAVLFFLILPLLVVMPFAASFYQDNKNNFINCICTRTKQKSYFGAKFTATFVAGGVTATVPLVFNFALCAAVLPCVLPQPASGVNIFQPKSTFSALYFLHPFLFTLISLLIIFIFAGTLAVSALYVAFYGKRIFTVLLYPFVLCLVIMSGADLLGAYSWQPMNFLNPAFNDPRLLPIAVETAVLFMIALWEFIHNGKKQDILS